MSVDRLLLEVTRGEWFLDTSNIYAYLPLLQNYFAGQAAFKRPDASAVNYLLNNDARMISEPEEAGSYAYVEMVGVITRYGDECTYGAEDYARMLSKIESNSKIKGTILRMNGPGGSVGALTPMLEFAKTKTKPIVPVIGMAASMHYWYAAVLGDYLIAEDSPVTKVGSIGVMATLVDLKKKYEADGIKVHEIYAPESEHKNEVFNLALEGKYDKIKSEELSPLAKAFQAAVRENRPNLKEETGVLTGKTFFNEDAKRLGLIDAVGTLKDAIRMIDVLSEINS